MTYDEAEAAILAAGITMREMSHDCDEKDPACTCEEPHAPGDVRCANRALHTPCSHDRALMRVRGIIVAAVAAMLSLPAHAQSVPPQVPRYNCYLTPTLQQQAQAIAQNAYVNNDVKTMMAISSLIKGWKEGCEHDYQRQMIQWQAEMQRWQLMNR